MADALRELIASFRVEVDADGNLAKGHIQVDALKGALAQLEARLGKLQTTTKPVTNALEVGFAKAAASAQKYLAAQNAIALTGRVDSNPFAAAGAMRSGAMQGPGRAEFLAQMAGGVMQGPGRAEFDAQIAGGVQFGPTRRTQEAFLSSFSGKLHTFRTAARDAFASFGASARRGFDAFKVAGDGAVDRLTSLRSGMAAFAAGATVRFAAGLIGQMGDIGEAAQKLGLSTGDFQRIRVLAEQNATSVEALGGAFRVLGKSAADPTKDTAAAFAQLGVQTKDQNGQLKSRQDLFFETAGALADVSNETERAALAQKLFGRGAQELGPLLAGGRVGLEAQRSALEKLRVVSDEQAAAADALGDRWVAFRSELLARVAPALTRYVIPGFSKLLDILGKVGDKLESWSKRVNVSSIAVAGLTLTGAKLISTLVTGGARVALAWAPWIAAFVALDDILTFLDGGKSVTGALADKLFGPGGGQKLREDILGIITAIKELLGLGAKGPAKAGNKIKLPGTDTEIVAVGRPSDEQRAADDAARAEIPWYLKLAGSSAGDPYVRAPGFGGAGATVTDSRQQSVTVNVTSTDQVAGAVSGAQSGMNARTPAADLGAMGDSYL